MKFQNLNNRTDYLKEKKLNNEKDRIDNGFHKGPKKTFCTIIKDKIPSKETRSSRRDWNSTFSDNKTFIQNLALIHISFFQKQSKYDDMLLSVVFFFKLAVTELA